MIESSQFRPQIEPRPLYRLNEDALAGLKGAVRNNQPLMALEYVSALFDKVLDRLDILESKLTSNQKPLENPAVANLEASEIPETKPKVQRKPVTSIE